MESVISPGSTALTTPRLPLTDYCFNIACMVFQVEMTREERTAIWRHTAPFLVWVVIMSIPVKDVALRYAVQTVAGVVALLIAKPWRYYSAPSLRWLPVSVLVGVAVFVLWVLPESSWAKRVPWLYDLYTRYAVRGGVSPVMGMAPYAPEQCGWLLSIMRLAGSAFVIAVIEEYFWRGFLMRWLRGRGHPFLSIMPQGVGWGMLLVSSCLFGLEHSRWLAGVLAGLAYGLLYIRTGDLWAAVTAHITTNYLLGLYVLATGAYVFW
jgi:CAAX prenyl protease-like protein